MKKLILVPFLVIILLVLCILLLALMPGKWLIPPLETTSSKLLGAEVRIGSLDKKLFSRIPSVTLSEVSVADSKGEELLDVQYAFGSINVGAVLHGSIELDAIRLDGAQVKLSTDIEGNGNWQHLVSSDQNPSPETTSTQVSLPSIRIIEVKDLAVEYLNLQTNLNANIMVDATGSSMLDTEQTTLMALGDFNSQKINLNVKTDSLKRLVTLNNEMSLDASLQLGDTSVSAKGTIGDPAKLRELDMTVSVEALALDDLAILLNVPLPVIPPFQLTGNVKRDGDDLILRRFTGTMGDTDISGDIRADQTTTPITLYANIISEVLDLDDLAGFIGLPADATETPVVDERLPLESAPNVLLPDYPLNLAALAEAFKGAIRYRAGSVRSPVWPIDSIDVRVEVEKDRISLSPFNLGVAQGDFNGSVIFELDGKNPEGTIEARVRQVQLRQLMIAAGIDDDSFGLLGGRLKFWIEGDTVSELAASADGGMFLLMTGGKMDALLTELAGVDLFESITLLLSPGKTRTEILCAYIDVHAENGVVSINRFLIDTDDTVFLADGSVDFNDESLDLILEPHPKDISILAAQTAVNIGGTFTSPSILPGSALATRAAAATALALIATPAAALLPFIQTGSGEDSPFCEGLIESIDDAR